jgi:hypothetical protein
MYYTAFCGGDETPEKIHLKEERLILAHGVHPHLAPLLLGLW